MINNFRLVLLSFVFIAFNQAVSQPDIAGILSDSSRPAADRDRDAGRKPDEVLAFLGIGSGDKVADLLCGGGYYTRIITPLVGDQGEVYAGNNPFFQRFGEEALTALLTEPGFENVHRIDGPVDELALPMDGSMDAVIIVLAYHDLWLTDEDRDELNRRVFTALKPGGVYGIIDHHAAEGAGTAVIESLHRIPDDDHSLRIFDPSIRGSTDRFVLRFEKP
jgi:predicted methyltransferase